MMHIVAKKWDPGFLDPNRFSYQIRKVEARLGKLEVRPKQKVLIILVWKLGKFDQIRKVGMGY